MPPERPGSVGGGCFDETMNFCQQCPGSLFRVTLAVAEALNGGGGV